MSATQVLVAPAKLTLSLRITGIRADGYHLVDAEMVTVDLVDTLSFSPGDGLDVTCTGAVSGVPSDDTNLVRRALAMVGRKAAVHLEKAIPACGGLGGGSADAAAVLRWAGATDLVAASRLGADVAFCMVAGRARVTGIGEIVNPLDFAALAGSFYTLVTPPFGVSTAAVYRAFDQIVDRGLDSTVRHSEAANDLEAAALIVEPRLARWRDELTAATNRQARLAGSGSTWFVEGDYPGDDRIVVRPFPPFPAARP